MSETFEPGTACYTPMEVSKYGLEYIEAMEKNQSRNVALGVDVLDDYVAPVQPGQVCAIIGQTSHYKSGFLHAIERNEANYLTRENRDEVLVHISVEELVEEQAFLEFATLSDEEPGQLARGKVKNWEALRWAATKIGTVPIYRIGASMQRADDMPNLYLSNIYRSMKYMLEEMQDEPLKVAAIYLDYLQALPMDPEHKAGGASDEKRRLQVRTDVFRLFQMAAYFRAPVFVGVQAKQKLDGAPSAKIQIPGVYDGEETSAIAQRFTRVLSLWMPKQTHSLKSFIDDCGLSFRVDEDLLFVKVCKQRGGLPAGKTFPCRIDFKQNAISVDRNLS